MSRYQGEENSPELRMVRYVAWLPRPWSHPRGANIPRILPAWRAQTCVFSMADGLVYPGSPELPTGEIFGLPIRIWASQGARVLLI